MPPNNLGNDLDLIKVPSNFRISFSDMVYIIGPGCHIVSLLSSNPIVAFSLGFLNFAARTFLCFLSELIATPVHIRGLYASSLPTKERSKQVTGKLNRSPHFVHYSFGSAKYKDFCIDTYLYPCLSASYQQVKSCPYWQVLHISWSSIRI